MSTAIDIDPLDLHLVASILEKMGFKPLIAGNSWHPRFQLRDADDEARDLTGVEILMTIRAKIDDGTALITRSTQGTATIFIDADQSVEADDETGRGWFEIRFSPADQSALLAALGRNVYDIRMKFVDGSVDTFARGIIEVLRPCTVTMP